MCYKLTSTNVLNFLVNLSLIVTLLWLAAIGSYINFTNSQEMHDLGWPKRTYFKNILKNGEKSQYAIILWPVESLDSTQGLRSAGYKSPE